MHHEYVRSPSPTSLLASRWSYYGTTNIFNNYIRAPLPPGSTSGAVDAAHRNIGVAGALGKGQETSFAIRTSAALVDTSCHAYAIVTNCIIRHFQLLLGICHSYYWRVRVLWFYLQISGSISDQYPRRHRLGPLQHDLDFQLYLLGWSHHPHCHLSPCFSHQHEWSLRRSHRFDSHYGNRGWEHQGECLAHDCRTIHRQTT